MIAVKLAFIHLHQLNMAYCIKQVQYFLAFSATLTYSMHLLPFCHLPLRPLYTYITLASTPTDSTWFLSLDSSTQFLHALLFCPISLLLSLSSMITPSQQYLITSTNTQLYANYNRRHIKTSHPGVRESQKHVFILNIACFFL